MPIRRGRFEVSPRRLDRRHERAVSGLRSRSALRSRSLASATVRLPALSNGVITVEVGVSMVEDHIITGAWLSKPLPTANGYKA